MKFPTDQSKFHQQNIAASEQRLRALVTATSDVIYSLSADWSVMRQLDGRGFLKDTHAPMTGWRTQNIYAEDLQRVNAAIDEAIREKKIFQMEHRVNRADGTTGWTFSRAVPILDDQGEIIEWFGTASDITDRILAEQDLEKVREDSEQQKRVYETIISTTPDLMYVFDLNYRFTYANSALLTMWGKTWDNAIGKTLLENGYEPWHAEMHEREIDKVKATKQPIRGEVSFPHAILGKRVYDYIFVPVLNEEGEVEAIAGTTRDITERKQWEESLAHASKELQAINEEMAAANEEMTATNEELTAIQGYLEQTNRALTASASRLRLAVESTGLGTWEYVPATGELYWSKECYEIFGAAANFPLDFDMYIRQIHPDDHDWVTARIKATLKPESVERYGLSHRIIRIDNGEVRWVKAQGTVEFENSVPMRFLGTVLDITELKQVEEQSARLAAIITSSDDAIISKTLESEIMTWNNAAQRMFGYTADEMIGETMYKLIPQDRWEEEPMILSKLKRGERVEHFETKRQAKDGRQIDVSLTISPINDNKGTIIGVSNIARDISERKQDEARKNDFIGMVSHELKTPLTSLSAIIQVADDKLKNSQDQFLAAAMTKANAQVKRMSTMINGFLNISRLESGKIVIEKSRFNIEKLLSEVIEEQGLGVGSHNIRLVKCDLVNVFADRDKINSVVSNLISNAVKYSPKNSTIRVSCNASESEVTVSVGDEGIGISSSDAAKIFDRYYRVESSNTRHISGFGIGLYLSAEIIERHDGKIWLNSEPGKGSTFYFSLPLQ